MESQQNAAPQFVTRDINLASCAIAAGGTLSTATPPPSGSSRVTFFIDGQPANFDLLVARGLVTVNAREVCSATAMLVSLVQANKRGQR